MSRSATWPSLPIPTGIAPLHSPPLIAPKAYLLSAAPNLDPGAGFAGTEEGGLVRCRFFPRGIECAASLGIFGSQRARGPLCRPALAPRRRRRAPRSGLNPSRSGVAGQPRGQSAAAPAAAAAAAALGPEWWPPGQRGASSRRTYPRGWAGASEGKDGQQLRLARRPLPSW